MTDRWRRSGLRQWEEAHPPWWRQIGPDGWVCLVLAFGVFAALLAIAYFE